MVSVTMVRMDHCDYCAQFVTVPARVLDVGSGGGKFVCQMAQRGFSVDGIEVNPEYIVHAQRKALAEGLVVRLTPGRGENIPFAENTFDFVNCAEVSEHVDDPQQMCNEIYRVLKIGGHCYISFHNRFGFYDYHYHLYFINWLPRRWAELILRLIGRSKLDGNAGRQRLVSMHYYTYRQAHRLLTDMGFKVTDIRTEKIKSQFHFLIEPLLLVYFLFRPVYFNSFHFLLEK